MSKKSQQIPLPFTLEGNVANRSLIRSVSKNSDGLRKVSLSQIKIRPGFNARTQGDIPDALWEQILMIPELAEGIFASNGPADALIGDIYAVDECFYPTDGERRARALRHLIATGRDVYPNGLPVDDVLVILNPAGTTDLQRKLKVGTTQGKLNLTPIQWAYYYLSLKTEYELTHQQIAESLNISRQKVDNYVLATELPKNIQEDIDADKVKISNALSDYRASKKKNDNPSLEDETTPSEDAHKRKKEKENSSDGDENDFIEQDNSIPGVSSMSGPKESGSGTHVVGKDSIYADTQKIALWRQFLNRQGVIKDDISHNLPGNNSMGETLNPEEIAAWAESELITRLKNEYNLTVK